MTRRRILLTLSTAIALTGPLAPVTTHAEEHTAMATIGDHSFPVTVTLADPSEPVILLQAVEPTDKASPGPHGGEHGQFHPGSSVGTIARGLLDQLIDVITTVVNAVSGALSG